MECGLLGRKLGHSYSPQIHSLLGDYRYSLFEREPEQLEAFLKTGDFQGINVTIPYKKAVIPFLDALTPTAQRLGSVNTIVRQPDGSLLGHNSDYFGFVSLIRHSGIAVAGKKVLVLGSGGTSAMAVQALLDLGARPVVISRGGENHYGNLHLHQDAAVIVNTTPVGMYPGTGQAPLALEGFPKLEGVVDVIYNPAKTKLLLDAQRLGIPGCNGLWMLVAQAKEAAEYFTGSPIEDAKIAAIYRQLSRQMRNLTLIGMPGSGKSTIGQQLAAVLSRKFVDLDAEIARQAGLSIPQIFDAQGEAGFRALETQVLETYSKESGLVLATGGGIVTQPQNLPLLAQNSHVCWLKRPLHLLPREGRPLSQQNSLAALYQAREPLYAQAADFSVWNEGSIQETVQEILSLWEDVL